MHWRGPSRRTSVARCCCLTLNRDELLGMRYYETHLFCSSCSSHTAVHVVLQKQKRSDISAASFPDEAPWLTSDIRVKLIDKKLNAGALYLKKGTVVDVLQPMVCDLVVDGKHISNVHQSQLETVRPHRDVESLILARVVHTCSLFNIAEGVLSSSTYTTLHLLFPRLQTAQN